MHACMYVCVYVCLSVCVCVCIYTYIYVRYLDGILDVIHLQGGEAAGQRDTYSLKETVRLQQLAILDVIHLQGGEAAGVSLRPHTLVP